jgi:hypothetical protein
MGLKTPPKKTQFRVETCCGHKMSKNVWIGRFAKNALLHKNKGCPCTLDDHWGIIVTNLFLKKA